MSRSVKALINPEMLIWARKTSSLSLEIAARKLKQKEDTIRLWEEGKTAPTFKQLLKICQVYKRPVSPLLSGKNHLKALNHWRIIEGFLGQAL